MAAPADWRAAFSLCKPRLSALVLCTTGVGLYLGGPAMAWPRALLVLLATAMVVGAANALNCYFERHSDALMHRTRQIA
ncbi:MAG: protoheme IX farnesyltransferase, partial [Deltaproteobacteria bacterium]